MPADCNSGAAIGDCPEMSGGCGDGLCTFDLYGAARGDARGVWADAVPARRGRLDLEAHILVVRVLQPDELLRLRVELHWQTSRAPSQLRARPGGGGGRRVLCGAVAAWGSARGSEPEAFALPLPADRRECGRDGHRPSLSLAAGESARPPWPAPRGAGRGLGVARVNRSTAGSILSCGTSSFPGPAMLAPEPERLPQPPSRQDGRYSSRGRASRCSLG